jgi:hypothetical protein
MSISLGLPKGLLPTPETALSAGTVSNLVRIQPNNVNTISSDAQNIPATATTYYNSWNFPSQLVQFSVPCGQGRHVWVDSEKSSMSFRVNYAVTTASVAAAAATGFLQEAASSWFTRLVHIGPNGQTLDDVVNLHLSEAIDHQTNINANDRASFAAGYGFLQSSTNNVQGHSITSLTGGASNTARNNYVSYEFPLPSSLLGKYAKGYFPAGSVNKLDIQMYTNSTVPISYYTGSAAHTTTGAVTFTIDNISLNLYYLTLDGESARMLGSPSMHYLHGITQRTASSTIAAGTSGYLNTLIGLRGKSCRQLFTRWTDNGAVGTANQLNGVFDSKMPMCSQLNYLLQGKDRFPQFPHNTQILPASVFNRQLMASERFQVNEQRSSYTGPQFFKYVTSGTAPTAATGYDQNVVDAGSTAESDDLSLFVFGEDLRKVHNSQVLDGYDLTVTANHFLETNILLAPSNGQTIFFTGCFDIIYEFDLAQGTINYRM